MSLTPQRGRFIVLEGIDGAGTTTQTERLVASLRARGHAVLATCEPSDGAIGKLIRSALTGRLLASDGETPQKLDWATLALLFAADRLHHVASVVRPALDAGTIVVSDRYTLSSLVYQSVTASDPASALTWVSTLNREAPPADLTLVLDVPVRIAAERRRARGGPEELFDALTLQERLAGVYSRASELFPNERILHLPGSASSSEVASLIAAAVAQTFPELG
jgi:dTMP kinase